MVGPVGLQTYISAIIWHQSHIILWTRCPGNPLRACLFSLKREEEEIRKELEHLLSSEEETEILADSRLADNSILLLFLENWGFQTIELGRNLFPLFFSSFYLHPLFFSLASFSKNKQALPRLAKTAAQIIINMQS